MSTKWRDSSEYLNSSDEVTKLQRVIEQLQQDNKVLHIRAQGVQVLGKVLQDSQESNVRLQKEVQKLKSDLAQKGIDSELADLSVCTSINDDSHSTTIAEQGDRNCLSLGRSTDNHDYVNVTTVSEPQSLSSGFPSLLPGDFHIKEIKAEFQHITSELDHLMRNAQILCENIERLPGNGRDTELQGKLTRLNSKLNEYVKEARTRETLSSALLSEEEKLKTKLISMEAEQASHENVVHQLKDKIDKSRKEIEEIQGEVKFFEETVVVKREQEPAVVARNEPLSIGSERSKTRSLSDESIVVKTPLFRTGSEACETCGQYQRQLAELQRQLLLVKAEKDEALKLKEEILDVNHKWDEQYKLLSSTLNKEISDLKNQIEVLKSVDNQRNPEIMEKKALDDRCKMLESELQQKQLKINDMQLLMRNQFALKHQQPPAPQNTSMEQPLSHLSLLGAAAPRPGTPTQSLPSWPGTTANGQQIPAELIDQIEVLKQQLRVYADDFATEREDRERNQAEKEKLREELDAVREQLQALEQQLQIYEEDFKREKREKESLQQQLRAKNNGGIYHYQDPLAQRARAVAEQQARVQAIREVHDREKERLLRGQQELQQQVYVQQPYSRIQSQYNPYGVSGLEYTTPPEWQRQNYPLLPRGAIPPHGPIAHPANQRSTRTSMYHGGEVQPDNDMVEDVIDSPVDNNDAEAAGVCDEDDKVVGLEECPRCLRKFEGEDSVTILKHIERCIS